MRAHYIAAILATSLGYAAFADNVFAARGEKVYDKTCVVCHEHGVSGAPRVDQRGEWAARVSKGTEALVASVKNGKGGMPPKGGNEKFTDDELRAAVEFILSKVR